MVLIFVVLLIITSSENRLRIHAEESKQEVFSWVSVVGERRDLTKLFAVLCPNPDARKASEAVLTDSSPREVVNSPEVDKHLLKPGLSL